MENNFKIGRQTESETQQPVVHIHGWAQYVYLDLTNNLMNNLSKPISTYLKILTTFIFLNDMREQCKFYLQYQSIYSIYQH